jgi:hypothetical protein
MRSRVMRTAVAALGTLCATCIATGAWASHIDTHSNTNMLEPAAWGLIVVGFGLLGVALRRRQPQELFA